jgi:hypothetical protein
MTLFVVDTKLLLGKKMTTLHLSSDISTLITIPLYNPVANQIETLIEIELETIFSKVKARLKFNSTDKIFNIDFKNQRLEMRFALLLDEGARKIAKMTVDLVNAKTIKSTSLGRKFLSDDDNYTIRFVVQSN